MRHILYAVLLASTAIGAQLTIDLGDAPDGANGDNNRQAFTKVNTNFTELYSIKANLAAPTFTGNFSWGAAGVRVTNDGDGAITFLGLGDGSDEDFTLNLDDTANTIAVSSSTGVTSFTFGGIGLSTDTLTLTGTGTLNGLDAVDPTSEATIEAAVDTLANLVSIQGRTITLADAGADAFFAWDDSASAYQNISAADARTAIESGVNILLETEIDASSELLALMDDETGTGALMFGTNPTFTTSLTGGTDAFIILDEHASAAGTAAAGTVRLYAKADGLLYSKDDAGTETLVSGGTGSFDEGGNYEPTGTWDFTGATVSFDTFSTTTLTIGTTLGPTTDDGAPLGDATHGFSDLFLASGALINFANGNAVITHSSGILTVSTGDLRVTTAGTNAASAVTVGGTQTLTNKSLTSPTLTTPSAFTTGGIITLAEGHSVALDPAGSADGAFSGMTVTGTAGSTLAFGDLIVLDPTDSRWELADANSASGADGDSRGMIGVCVLAAAADGSATKVLLQGIVRADAVFPTFTINAPVYISETAGDVTGTSPTTEDNVVRALGYAMTADEMYFNPSATWITYDAP